MADPVLIHAANATAASQKYGIPRAVILGLLSVEGGTNADGTPRAPGDGAGPASYGQFTFGTGKALGVKYGDSASEVDAVARYLTQLGYAKDPRRAIAAYNGGPGNPQYDYAAKVIAASKRYGNNGDLGTANPTAPASTKPAKSGGLFDGLGSTLLHGLVVVGVVLAAAYVFVVGARKTVEGASA